MSRTDRIEAPLRIGLLVALSWAIVSCGDKITNSENNVGGVGGGTTAPARRVVGVAELRFDNITSINVSSSILLAASVADLDRLRASATPVSDLATVELQSIITGEFSAVPQGGSKTRFLRASYGLRNTTTDSALFDPSRDNLSFVAVQTAATIPGTPVRLFQRADGSTIAGTVATQLAPTQLMAVDGDGNLITLASDVEATVGTDDVKRTTLPTGALSVVPFSYVVRQFTPAPGAGGQTQGPFDGLVTFAFKIPDQTDPQNNPTTFSVLFLIVQTTGAAGTP